MKYANYWTVHDLVCEVLALQERANLMGAREPFTPEMQAEIEGAIRDAVRREAVVDKEEPEVGDWVCYKYADGTAISVVQYIVDKTTGAMPEASTKREYVTFLRTLERDDILEIRRKRGA